MTCPKCGAELEARILEETKRRGLLTILIYIVLLFIPIIGWIALFKLLAGSNKTKNQTYLFCPKCGYKKKR